jgi:hypothetical protein
MNTTKAAHSPSPSFCPEPHLAGFMQSYTASEMYHTQAVPRNEKPSDRRHNDFPRTDYRRLYTDNVHPEVAVSTVDVRPPDLSGTRQSR